MVFSSFPIQLYHYSSQTLQDPSWNIAVEGLPYFAADFIFFGINNVIIGYYMSLERLHQANILTIIRGILPILFFFTLPSYYGNIGLWIAIAAADCGTTLTILLFLAIKRYKTCKTLSTT